MGRADENKELKRKAIMDAGFRLFTNQGVANTSIADITKESGVAKGTFYLYFRDKYDLQEHLIVQKSEQLFRHAVKRSGYKEKSDPAEQILAIMDDILFQLNRSHRLLKFINKNLSWGVFKRALGRSGEDFGAVFREILGDGRIPDGELEVYSYLVIESIGSTCVSVILENDPVSFEEYLPYLHNAIRAIIRFSSKERP